MGDIFIFDELFSCERIEYDLFECVQSNSESLIHCIHVEIFNNSDT